MANSISETPPPAGGDASREGPGREPTGRDGSHREEVAGDGPDIVTVPARQGLEAVDILRLSSRVGPVLHNRAGDSLAFLVPPGTADCWDVPGSSCRHAAGEPQAQGTGWLVPPRTGTAVTDPAVLRAALGQAARNVELAEGLDGG